jgi:hypothetical protein
VWRMERAQGHFPIGVERCGDVTVTGGVAIMVGNRRLKPSCIGFSAALIDVSDGIEDEGR